MADVGGYDLEPAARAQITQRLTELSQRLEQEPKSGRWKRRARLGERKRWYHEPEEV